MARFSFEKRLFLLFFFFGFTPVFLSPAKTFAGWIDPRSPDHSPHRLTFSFPFCPDVTGEIKASYDEGWHAIVGDPLLRSGSDTVYHIGDNKFAQCYCPEEGYRGIQTNWLPQEFLSGLQKTMLLSSGWVGISKGSDWGLPDIPFFARNLPFSCKKGKEKAHHHDRHVVGIKQ